MMTNWGKNLHIERNYNKHNIMKSYKSMILPNINNTNMIRSNIRIPIRRKFTSNNYTDIVNKLDLDVNVETYFQSRDKLDKKIKLIEDSNEIYLKRMNIHIEDIKDKTESSKKKVSSKGYESKLEETITEGLKTIKSKKEKYNQNNFAINKLYKENELILIETDLIANPDKYNSKSIKLIKSFSRKNDELKIKELNEIKDENIKNINTLREESINILIDIQNARSLVKNAKRELCEHYHLMLYEGLDFRNEGLITFIKKIWSLGKEVDMSFMPSYLDSQGIDFLFSQALRTIQVDEKKKEIEDAKLNLSNELLIYKQKEEKIQNEQTQFFSTGLKVEENSQQQEETSNYSILMQKYKNENEEKKYTVQGTLEMIEKKKMLPEYIKQEIKKIQYLKYELMKIEEEIKEYRRREIDRIIKEFIMYDYGRRFRVGIETLIAAICGENQKTIEMVNFYRLERRHKENVKLIKLCSSFKNEY